jgi:hypothetical protein
MSRILCVTVDHVPGKLGEVSRLLADAGINIQVVSAHGGTLLLVVDDLALAVERLRGAGHAVEVEDALDVGLPNWPGELASLGEALGKAGVNILAVFGSTAEGRMHVRVDKPAVAKPILERFGPTRIPLDRI